MAYALDHCLSTFSTKTWFICALCLQENICRSLIPCSVEVINHHPLFLLWRSSVPNEKSGKTSIRKFLQSAGFAHAHPLSEGIQLFTTTIKNIHLSPGLCTWPLLTQLFTTVPDVCPSSTEPRIFRYHGFLQSAPPAHWIFFSVPATWLCCCRPANPG